MKKSTSSTYDDEEDTTRKAYTVVAVAPPEKEDLKLGDTMSLTVMFDSVIDTRAVAANLPDASRICRLQSMVQDNRYINPARQYYRTKNGRLHFEFAKEAERIKDTYTNNGRSADSACYKLACINEPLFEGGAYIMPFQPGQNFKYCFNDLDSQISSYSGEYGVVKCNPYAKAKMDDGKCVCTFPYTGQDCELCS